MAKPAETQMICDSVLGETLTQEECEQLSEIIKHKSIPAGEILFDAGDRDHCLYLLVEGKLQLTKNMGMGKEMHIATLKPGSMLGEMAFIDGKPHSIKTTALKDSELLLLEKNEFKAFVEQQPILTYHILCSIIRYVHTIQQEQSEQLMDMHRMVQNEYTAQY